MPRHHNYPVEITVGDAQHVVRALVQLARRSANADALVHAAVGERIATALAATYSRSCKSDSS